MRLTVLGSSASFSGAGRACSGHLIEAAGARVVLDLGNGAHANLCRATDPYSVDAVFITHLHPDHYLDLFSLMAMVRYAPDGARGRMALRGPDGLVERMACLLSSHAAGDVDAAFAFEPLRANDPVRMGDLTVTPRPVAHAGESFALVAEAGGRRLCYASDAILDDDVRAAAAGCHTLLAEATLPEEYAGAAPHMTATEAARLAAESGAERLVLTHLWPTVPRERILNAATAVFAGEVVLADELLVIEV